MGYTSFRRKLGLTLAAGAMFLGIGTYSGCGRQNQPTITLEGKVDNTGGGKALLSDFRVGIDGNPVKFDTKSSYNVGDHTVNVLGAPAEYTATVDRDCDAQGNVKLATAADNKICNLTFAYAPQQAATTTESAQEPAARPPPATEQKTRTEQKKSAEQKPSAQQKGRTEAQTETTTQAPVRSVSPAAGGKEAAVRGTPRARARSALEVKCDVTQKECYRPLGPVVFESYIGGQHYRDAPRLKGCERTVNGRHYTLCAEDDSVTLRLPRAPLEPGYRVRMVPRTNDPVVREILSSGQITVPKLRQLPGARLDTTVNVQLYRQADDGRIEICSSYNEHIRAELCETTAQPPAAPPEQPAPLPQQPAPPPPAQPQPTQTQTQQQNQTVIVNPPAEAPPAPQPVPQHAPQPIPPPHPVPPPTIPQASYTHPFLFSGRIGADQLSTKVSLAQKNAFCNLPDCNVVPLSQTFRASPAYGLNFQYNKKTLNASVDATGSEMKLKSANLDANGNAATLLPTGIERQTVSADAVKTFKTGWRVRPGVNAGGSYTRVKLTDPRSHATNNLWAGYIGGAAVYGNQARSHVTATGGYSSQDVQVLYVAPTFNNTSMPSANIRPFYGQVGGRQLLWKDHIDLYGKFRAYTAADTKYGSSQLRVSNNQNYNAGLRFWINPQSKVSFAPGVEYNGWRQKITSGSSHRSITDNALYGSINVEFGGKEEIRQP